LDRNNSLPKLNSSQICNILTLRYDPSQTPILPKLSWSDFVPHTDDVTTLEEIESIIKKSLEDNLLDENKISLALSGGIDSTLVLSMLKKFLPEKEIEAFSVQFANSVDETSTSKKISEHFDINYNKIFIENFFEELPKAIDVVKYPFWDLHWYYVVKKASKTSSCILSGDGGDELFGGYTFRYQKFLNQVTSNSSPIEKIQSYLSCHERDFVPDQEKIFGKNISFSWEDIYSQLMPYFDNSLSNLDQVFLADYNGKLLYNFSPNNQKISSHFKLKLFTPILNSDLIYHATHMPNQYKYDLKNNIGKLPLRDLLTHHNSSHLISTQKLGFSVDTRNLWLSSGYNLCKDFLLESEISKENWINGDWIKSHLKKDLEDVRYINKFFGLLALEIWFRLFITKSLKSNTLL